MKGEKEVRKEEEKKHRIKIGKGRGKHALEEGVKKVRNIEEKESEQGRKRGVEGQGERKTAVRKKRGYHSYYWPL